MYEGVRTCIVDIYIVLDRWHERRGPWHIASLRVVPPLCLGDEAAAAAIRVYELMERAFLAPFMSMCGACATVSSLHLRSGHRLVLQHYTRMACMFYMSHTQEPTFP